MSKRIYIVVALVLVFTLAFSFAAFADPEDETTPAETQQTEAPVETQAPPETEAPQAEPQPETEAPQTKPASPRSNDSTLKSLTVVGKTESGEDYEITLDPEFNPATRTYNISVPYEVVRLEIKAVANQSGARISIPSGYLTLDVGENRTFVNVTAEDGTVRRYQINTVRNEEVVTEPVTEETTEATTEAPTTEPETTEVIATTEPVPVKQSMNKYTKLGIVFAACGVLLFIISVAMLTRKKNGETED